MTTRFLQRNLFGEARLQMNESLAMTVDSLATEPFEEGGQLGIQLFDLLEEVA